MNANGPANAAITIAAATTTIKSARTTFMSRLQSIAKNERVEPDRLLSPAAASQRASGRRLINETP